MQFPGQRVFDGARKQVVTLLRQRTGHVPRTGRKRPIGRAYRGQQRRGFIVSVKAQEPTDKAVNETKPQVEDVAAALPAASRLAAMVPRSQ